MCFQASGFASRSNSFRLLVLDTLEERLACEDCIDFVEQFGKLLVSRNQRLEAGMQRPGSIHCTVPEPTEGQHSIQSQVGAWIT